MKEVMLSAHFIGLAMALGTSIAFMFLGFASAKMDKKEAQDFTLKTFALRKMGNIGITLLVLSGGYLMTPYWKAFGNMPLLVAKLSLVLFLIIVLLAMNFYAGKAKKGDIEPSLKKIKTFGKISLLTTLAIVILAVSVFH